VSDREPSASTLFFPPLTMLAHISATNNPNFPKVKSGKGGRCPSYLWFPPITSFDFPQNPPQGSELRSSFFVPSGFVVHPYD
jgi:hypothetical protein